ncbi:MAG: hypothetical protein RLZZ52_179 [Actinomycetota bacterium]|jgi:TRAP-type C4-dicarboxylate transport system permease small subunit
MATEDTYVATRAERILGTMVITIVVFSVLAFLAIITAGITQLDLTSAIGSVILVLPGIGLPIAFILMIALLVLNMIRRRKNASAGSR